MQHVSKCDGVNPDTKKDAISKEAPKKRKSKVMRKLSETSKEESKVPGNVQVEQNIELNDINNKSRKRKRTAPDISVKVMEEYEMVETCPKQVY